MAVETVPSRAITLWSLLTIPPPACSFQKGSYMGLAAPGVSEKFQVAAPGGGGAAASYTYRRGSPNATAPVVASRPMW